MERLVPPYALIRRHDADPARPDELELLSGRVETYALLADLPRVEDAGRRVARARALPAAARTRRRLP
jgi:hypothetical protein